MLRSAEWLLVTDVSGQPIAPVFNTQTVQEESKYFSDCLNLNVLRDIRQVRKSHILRQPGIELILLSSIH